MPDVREGDVSRERLRPVGKLSEARHYVTQPTKMSEPSRKWWHERQTKALELRAIEAARLWALENLSYAELGRCTERVDGSGTLTDLGAMMLVHKGLYCMFRSPSWRGWWAGVWALPFEQQAAARKRLLEQLRNAVIVREAGGVADERWRRENAQLIADIEEARSR